jgi:low affinity Fe/Cu permease
MRGFCVRVADAVAAIACSLRGFRVRVADAVAAIACSFEAFLCACVVVVLWAATGPHFGYSDTWQLIINTGTTIVTFLMAFLIGANQMRQADRDRDTIATLKAEFEEMAADHATLHAEHRAMHAEHQAMHAELTTMQVELIELLRRSGGAKETV